ncbi:MAG: hypothetical protein LKE43_06630 [Olsenella sp.]|jgi:hypothetical protein|nr:hypothetical protein [Olsenella sp.]
MTIGIYIRTFIMVGMPKIIGSLISKIEGQIATLERALSWADLQNTIMNEQAEPEIGCPVAEDSVDIAREDIGKRISCCIRLLHLQHVSWSQAAS